MAFSTQKQFFHVPFMCENVDYECKISCVQLKSYESNLDERSWSWDYEKRSKYLSDLVTCRFPTGGPRTSTGKCKSKSAGSSKQESCGCDSKCAARPSRQKMVGSSGRSRQQKVPSASPSKQKMTRSRQQMHPSASPSRQKMVTSASPSRQKMVPSASPSRQKMVTSASPTRQKVAASASRSRQQMDPSASPSRQKMVTSASPSRQRMVTSASPPRQKMAASAGLNRLKTAGAPSEYREHMDGSVKRHYHEHCLTGPGDTADRINRYKWARQRRYGSPSPARQKNIGADGEEMDDSANPTRQKMARKPARNT